MSDWSDIFLGLIALATVIMALVQVGAVVAAARLAGRINRLATEIETEIKPVLGQLNVVSADAARAVSLAVGQMERIDQMITDVTSRIEQTVAAVQHLVVTPAREGWALISAIRAAAGALRLLKTGAGTRLDDEDALFIG